MTYYFHRNWNFQTVMLLEHLTADKLGVFSLLKRLHKIIITARYVSRRRFYPSIILWSATSCTGSLIGLVTYTSHRLHGYGIAASCI